MLLIIDLTPRFDMLLLMLYHATSMSDLSMFDKKKYDRNIILYINCFNIRLNYKGKQGVNWHSYIALLINSY